MFGLFEFTIQCLIYSGKGWIFIRFYSQFCMFQVLKWMEYAEGLSKDCFAALEKLNVELAVKSVVLGDGLTPSAADVAVFAALHSSVVMDCYDVLVICCFNDIFVLLTCCVSQIGLSDSDKEKIPHVIRWVNYIQVCQASL